MPGRLSASSDGASRSGSSRGMGQSCSLHALHTRSKHAEEAIEKGNYIEDSPLCVWLTNSGLSSTDAALTFDEIAEILIYMARMANAVQDPRTMKSKIESLMSE